MSSVLSLKEIKELIAYAREQKVIVLERSDAGMLRFQFSAIAYDPEPEKKPVEKPKPEEETPFGRFNPDQP